MEDKSGKECMIYARYTVSKVRTLRCLVVTTVCCLYLYYATTNQTVFVLSVAAVPGYCR